MKPNVRELWYDAAAKVAVTLVDVTDAAQALVRGHLAGPASAHFLTEGLAAAALFGAETSEAEETVVVQMKCEGPLGGYNVECTAAGTLRGYTEKKTLDEFDADPAACAKAAVRRRILGLTRYQITRSVPGRILSQGVATSLDGYLAGSLQRKATIRLEARVNDEAEVLEARGVLVEDLPDATGELVSCRIDRVKSLAVASRKILSQLGLAQAELRAPRPLAFACRCSAERAAELLAALPPEERAALPPSAAITCHMCGRTWNVNVPA